MSATPNINKITRRYYLQKSMITPPARKGISGNVVVSLWKHSADTENTLLGAMC